jgi:asparaginyl-tRNA synthetase
MKKRIKIVDALRGEQVGQPVTVMGWVRSFRNNQFIALNDGSCFGSLQIVVDIDKLGLETAKRLTAGAAISVDGLLIASQGKGQTVEVTAQSLEILGDCPADEYPLQLKNRPSLEYLREIAHLRFRTNTFGAIFRVRHALSFAIHQFYNQRGFVCMHSPIITGSDAEGAGEMFRVTTLPLDKLPKTADGKVDFKQDFFEKSTHLTVSGQLEAELAALALGQVYTFGPTFRAENSNTSRHLAEFWMIEPEVAFADLTDNMNLAEDMLKYVIEYALTHCREDLDFLNQRFAEEDKSKPVAERAEMGLLEKLQFCLKEPFQRLTYTEAIEILKNSTPNKKGKFKYPIKAWGADLQSEHERYLVEKHFKKPVILTDYPMEIKAFYMRQNNDGKTVAAMDILFPGIGEIIGGSQREERLEKLKQRMLDMHIPIEEMQWFLDTRRFGSCPHAGFGLGFERLILFITGMTNIRDVIPFPRFPGSATF